MTQIESCPLPPTARATSARSSTPSRRWCIDPAKRYTADHGRPPRGRSSSRSTRSAAPRTVNNFVFLARVPLLRRRSSFHRIIPGFVLQGGDPEGTGSGGPGYRFADELPKPGRYQIGSLAMANAGPDTNGSQFFIISGPDGARLPPQYSLFGAVVSGGDVVAAIDATGSRSGTPKERVVIESVTIQEH